jgi:hypothetical protein
MNHRGGRKAFPEQAIEVSVANREILMALNHLNRLFQWKIQSPITIATQSRRGGGNRRGLERLEPLERLEHESFPCDLLEEPFLLQLVEYAFIEVFVQTGV